MFPLEHFLSNLVLVTPKKYWISRHFLFFWQDRVKNCICFWHRFIKGLEIFLREFGPYWYSFSIQLLQIVGYTSMIWISVNWIQIWWLWRPFKYSKLTLMFKKPVEDHFNFVQWLVSCSNKLSEDRNTVVIKGRTWSARMVSWST